MKIPSRLHTAILALILGMTAAPALALEADDTLGFYSDWQEVPVSSGRAPKPLSQTAENVTVLTSREIEALNPHTLADILAGVPGVQLETHGGPGSTAFTNIQSSQFYHVLVLVDGIPLNNLADNFADVALVPARIIERVEIVKGAASAAWGQALGGVINVITKAPEPDRKLSGAVSASLGERTISDSSVELSGTNNQVGYLLSGGYLGGNGLLPNNQFYSGNLYGKLSYDLPDKGTITSSFSYSRANRGEFASTLFDYKGDDSVRYLNGALAYRQPLGANLELELTGRHTTCRLEVFGRVLSSDLLVQHTDNRESATGAGAKLVWREADNLLVVGGDYEHATFSVSDALLQVDQLNRTVDRWGLYLNDALTIGPVTISGGGRFDRTQSGGDQTSYSIGGTWQLSPNTLLRGYTARGFSLPALVYNRTSEKVWTSQFGIESREIPGLWLKGTLFRNETWDVVATPPALRERRIAVGYELEARTTPVYNTSLSTGYTFTDTTRTSDGSQVKGAPRQTVQLALRYDDLNRFRALLTARHIWWNTPATDKGRYYGMIWDLHLGATVYRSGERSLELFCSGHNLFNGDQYTFDLYPNPARWFEGGLKVRF